MAENAVVNEAKGETTAEKHPVAHALEGAGMAQDFIGGTEKILSGDWTEGLLDLAAGGLDIKELIKDPMQALVSMGLGWVIEHVSFLKEPLDWLTGNQDTLDLTVQTWQKISEHIQKTAEDLTESARKDCAHWEGAAADEYRAYLQDQINLYVGLSEGAKGVSGLVDICKSILNVVRTIIRDLIADALAKIIKILTRYPPPAYPAALAAEGVPFAVEKATEAMSWVQKLTRVFQKAMNHIAKLGKLLGDAARYLGRQLAHNTGVVFDNTIKTMRELGTEAGRAAMKDAAKEASQESAKKLGKDVAIEGGKEMGKTILKNWVDGATASDTDPDKQPSGHESAEKNKHDWQETRISPDGSTRRISGKID
ncbi:hypothetical protein [Amycolatopsis anabasis]|uniref:hypothetical protein n=1 Tax=Amycolatopsis anabasis TaxID=1840409 RepID=UPI00131CBE35|nr:hypothetical protein [Amycolatopsis anabasis]